MYAVYLTQQLRLCKLDPFLCSLVEQHRQSEVHYDYRSCVGATLHHRHQLKLDGLVVCKVVIAPMLTQVNPLFDQKANETLAEDCSLHLLLCFLKQATHKGLLPGNFVMYQYLPVRLEKKRAATRPGCDC